MEVLKTRFDFDTLRSRTQTRSIVIHHSASPDVSAADIHRWHLEKGWSGIGYHYVIRKDGTIEEGRPLEMQGAHAGPKVNPDSIGICLSGNFMQYPPADKQMASLLRLVFWLRNYYRSQLTLLRHKDLMPTKCPGDFFPWKEFLYMVDHSEPWKHELMENALEVGILTEKHHPDDFAPKWFVVAVALKLLEKISGTDTNQE
jgi:N-acetyl-anhydromuramyl-L-alanine amidase AmpD